MSVHVDRVVHRMQPGMTCMNRAPTTLQEGIDPKMEHEALKLSVPGGIHMHGDHEVSGWGGTRFGTPEER